MPCLLFDGTDDHIVYSTMSAAMQDFATGACTCAVLHKRNASPSFSGMVHNLQNLADWTSMNWSLEEQGTTITSAAVENGNNLNITQTSTANVNYLTVVSKASGTVAPIGQIYNIDTGSWTSPATAAATDANSTDTFTSTAKLVVGAWILNSAITDPFPGRIGLVAFWTGVAMTQAQKEECATNERTSDLFNHSAGTPTCLIEVTSRTVLNDLGGGCGSIFSITGCTEDSDNLGWNFDGTGSVTPGVEAQRANIRQYGSGRGIPSPGVLGPSTDRCNDWLGS